MFGHFFRLALNMENDSPSTLPRKIGGLDFLKKAHGERVEPWVDPESRSIRIYNSNIWNTDS
jgi:hypothetical protein